MENEVIDLTESFYCRAPVNLSCSVIELDDSINDPVPVASPAPTSSQPINVECETDVLPEVNISKKAKTNKKNRESRTSNIQKKPIRERSPHLALGDCPICRDPLGTRPLAATKCGHVYCIACVKNAVKFGKRCPTCRKPLTGAAAYHPLFL